MIRGQVPSPADLFARLADYRKEGETDADFARRLGWSEGKFNNYKKGRHRLTLQPLLQALVKLGASPDYVILGVGDKDRPPDPDEAQRAVMEARPLLRAALDRLEATAQSEAAAAEKKGAQLVDATKAQAAAQKPAPTRTPPARGARKGRKAGGG